MYRTCCSDVKVRTCKRCQRLSQARGAFILHQPHEANGANYSPEIREGKSGCYAECGLGCTVPQEGNKVVRGVTKPSVSGLSIMKCHYLTSRQL